MILLWDGEEPAANALRINESVPVASQYQHTIEIVAKAGDAVMPVCRASLCTGSSHNRSFDENDVITVLPIIFVKMPA